jgi:hypothetical protein
MTLLSHLSGVWQVNIPGQLFATQPIRATLSSDQTLMNPDTNGGSTSSAPNLNSTPPSVLRKFSNRLAPGQTEYLIRHDLGTEDVIVQTRIANRIREGGIAIHDPNTVRIIFGGVLNEPLDVVIIG